jgi:AmmeMemoRadiSam system protein B
MKRLPAVAGKFYEGHPERLVEEVSKYVYKTTRRSKVIGALVPHAGLMYSGAVAGTLYSSIQIPDTFVIIGPNHTGVGPDLAVMSSGDWEIPFASFGIDEELAKSMLENMPMLKEDAAAHAQEHSIEVQLPLITPHAHENLSIVPVVAGRLSLQECEAAGKGLAAAITSTGRNTVIIASSDMSHYVNDAEAREKDGLAIGRILDLDAEGLYNTVAREGISMCGVVPATIMLYTARELGATDAYLMKYATSGDINKDYASVVGYASIKIM